MILSVDETVQNPKSEQPEVAAEPFGGGRFVLNPPPTPISSGLNVPSTQCIAFRTFFCDLQFEFTYISHSYLLTIEISFLLHPITYSKPAPPITPRRARTFN